MEREIVEGNQLITNTIMSQCLLFMLNSYVVNLLIYTLHDIYLFFYRKLDDRFTVLKLIPAGEING